MSNKHELWELQSMQQAPLSVKVSMTKQRIREWVNEFGVDGVYVSFSGGKDSTVLLTIAREMYGDSIKGVFIDTGLEYPEIRSFVKTWDNIDWAKPKMNFKQVIEKYGYPFISKEVSEAVWGARKYLTSLIGQGMLNRPTDRPTDRPSEPESAHKWWCQKYRQVTGAGEYAKSARGRHNIPREEQIYRAILKAEQDGIGSGGTVRDFTNRTGVRTSKGTIEPRLWKNYSQFASSTSDGDKQQTGDQSSDNEGEYP